MSIEVRNVSKRFNGVAALDAVDLLVPSGKLVALLGPSGSGKTTLLRIIAGLDQADPGGGAILFHDEDVAATHVRHRQVGFVFQHYALFRHLSVFENVAFGLRVKPRSLRPPAAEIAERVHELLRLVQLDGMAARLPNQLSGGQRQRVALARALAVEPRVLLLDEPFGALDAKVRKELRSWLRHLHDELQVTSLFVTHDQDEALEVADEVVVMNAGRIEQVGTPDEVFHHPRTEFVMRFLGEVNSFHGRIDAGVVQFGPLALPYPHEHQQVSGAASIYVRPHDVTIDSRSDGHAAMAARIERVHSAGAAVRIELLTESGQALIAELSQERYTSMQLVAGGTVYLRPRHIRVFADEARRAAPAAG